MSEPPTQPVLLVDDEELNLRVFSTILKQSGYRVVSTQKPKEALGMIQEHQPGVVVLDVNMPDLDGLTLLTKIKEKSRIPVLMLTGIDRSETAVKALKLGAFDYLTKPVDFRKLLDTVRLALESSAEPAEERRIDRYEVGREIGRGGMGVVYEAREVTLDRPVALKVLLPELSTDPYYELLFLREARAAAKVSHPGIVTVYGAGRYRGQLYLAMELVKGTTLHQLLGSGTGFKPKEAVEVGLKAAEALQAAHEAGLIHRDIKPGNLMMTPELRVKILDFGLARPVQPLPSQHKTATFAGTVAYAAPEQLQNRDADGRADIFALGVVLYEMLAHEYPYEGQDSFTIGANIIKGQVKRSIHKVGGLPKELQALVAAMMQPDREARPADMKQVASALRRIAG